MKEQLQKVEKLFSDYLEQNQLKYTPERQRILREVFSLHNHFEADELYFALRE
jgi:Fur family ferric uptake transcriptional regulator